jgi:hypothetical protein
MMHPDNRESDMRLSFLFLRKDFKRQLLSEDKLKERTQAKRD